MKTCGASFWDSINEGDRTLLTPVCGYNAGYSSSYEDAYWHYNAGEHFGIEEKYYGLQTYFSELLF